MQEDRSEFVAPEPLNLAVATIAERSQEIVAAFLDRQARDHSIANVFDPLMIGDAFLQMTAQLLASPVTLVEAQMSMWNDYMRMWQNTARDLLGSPAAAVEAESKPTEWRQGDIVDFVKQSYLLTARWIQSLLRDAQNLDEETAQQVDFYTRQFVDAMEPAKVQRDNIELLRLTTDSRGENLLRGLDHLLAELERNKSQLTARPVKRRQTAKAAKIVLRNSAIELRHYCASADRRHPTPILLVPSWTHSADLIDLTPQHSLAGWLTEQGYDLYVISWRSDGPNRDLADSANLGPQAALARIQSLTGCGLVHGAGIGLGGTLLAATQAKMRASGQDGWASASYFASLLDFSDPGEISVFIAEEQLRRLDDSEASGAAGQALVDLLRANDLIWSYVLDCFLGERDALPVALMRWNRDSLPIPDGMLQFHLRDLYQKNLLARRDALSIDKVGLDLARIDLPTYLLAMGQDHLAPWRSVYEGTRLLGGTLRFVRAGGGHINGLLNPPARRRLGFWTCDSGTLPADPSLWQQSARFQPGSWWQDWSDWLAQQS